MTSRLAFALMAIGVLFSVGESRAENLLREQRMFYSAGNWQRFFANAIHYRHRLAYRPGEEFQPDALGLELLALAKHCQWDAASRIAQWSLSQAEAHPAVDSSLLHETIVHFGLLHRHPGLIQTQPDLARSPIGADRILWPIEPERVAKLADARLLRVIVPNRCADH